MISTKVVIDSIAEKQLKKIPQYIRDKLYQWVEKVEILGIEEIRKAKGYHDEPWKGNRSGERSIRLNKSYRVIYIQKKNFELTLVIIN